MDPFFGDFSWYNQSIPFRQSFSKSQPEKPKSVQIPVQFTKPKPINRSVFARKIQRVFRGFLVRKSMKRILDVKKDVDLIGYKLSKREIVNLVRKDEKERLRMNESLMSLLFKLDSVRGFDLGVRECRKGVIRKVIALQERIDDIVAVELCENDEKVENEENLDGNCDCEVVELCENDEKVENEGNLDGNCDCEVRKTENVDSFEGALGKDEESDIGEWVEVVEESKEDRKRNSEMMERMKEDNAKMMDMMTELVKSNEKQMKMLGSLSNRVEMLEKAIMCEKRKNKKQKKPLCIEALD